MLTSKYFNLGQILVTQGISGLMAQSSRFALEIGLRLKRYSNKDWGKLSDEDIQANEEALLYHDDIYILGVYPTCEGVIWIITNRAMEKAGDNVTTVCFPNER